MGLLFQGSHHLFESLNLGSGNTSRDFPLKLQQMAADTVCKFATFRGQRDDKRAPIRFPTSRVIKFLFASRSRMLVSVDRL